MLIKLISPLVAVLVFIVLPLWLIARRAKAGKSVKKPLIANLCGFFLVMFATAVVFLGQGVAAAQDLQWAEGIQRRGQRAEAAVLDICHHTHGGTEPVGHMVHILAAVRQVSSRIREDTFFRQGL